MDLDLDGLPSWMADAACLGIPARLGFDPWFPVNGEPHDAALAVCAGCPVREPCLDLALTEGHWYGIWGGMTPEQRAKLDRAA